MEDAMQITDRNTWRRFVYDALYPAVLGSLLYDALHFRADWGPVQLLGLSITALCVIDCLHVYADWREKPEQADIWANALVAIALGVAYWQASDYHLRYAYLTLAGITVIELVFNWARKARIRHLFQKLWPLVLLDVVLIAAFLLFALLLSDARHLTWEVAWLSFLPAGIIVEGEYGTGAQGQLYIENNGNVDFQRHIRTHIYSNKTFTAKQLQSIGYVRFGPSS